MFWRAIKNSKLLRAPELVLPFCIRLAPQKISGTREHANDSAHDAGVSSNCADGGSGRAATAPPALDGRPVGRMS